MLIGFGGLIIIMIIGGSLYFKTNKERWLYLGGALGLIFCMFFVFYIFDNPGTLNYRANVEGQQIFFNSYQFEGRDIKIPVSYSYDKLWYNHYDYCDSPITIVVPEGQTVEIVDLRPTAVPYIIGGCK